MKTRKMKVLLVTLTALVITIVVSGTYQKVSAHCQIPCGIYNDDMRFTMLEENVTTIEKSMKMITELSNNNPEANTNQIVRWVVNKDHFADEVAEIVVQYFLQQRVKPVSERSGPTWNKYVKQLTLCHNILVTSMKTKQSTDLAQVDQLRTLIGQFKSSYLN